MKMTRTAALALCAALAAGALAAGCASAGRAPESVPALERAYSEATLEAAALLGRSPLEIEDDLGPAWRMVNVGGVGFYGYAKYGVYFDDIVFVYENGFKLPIEGNPARVIAVDCLSEAGLEGLVRDTSTVGEVLAALGKPDETREIAGGDEIANPFAGRYQLYRVEGGFLAFRVEGDIVRSIMLIDGSSPAFR